MQFKSVEQAPEFRVGISLFPNRTSLPFLLHSSSAPSISLTTNIMSFKENFTLSSLSLSSDDWDRSEGEINPSSVNGRANLTPRNSVIFPGDGAEDTPGRRLGGGKEGRSLSELMRLHAEKGTDVTFSAEEASRVADVLKQWVSLMLSFSARFLLVLYLSTNVHVDSMTLRR